MAESAVMTCKGNKTIGDYIMGMSASQARLLSLTSRMHDLEFQAQGIQYSKLDLVNTKQDVYDEYLDTLDSTKYQMTVLTANGNEYQDITYTNMIMANIGNGVHNMYTITNAMTGQILLPEQITSKIDPMPDNVDSFLEIVAKNYLYSSRMDLNTRDEYIQEMQKDGNYSYWKAIFWQLGGYKDDDGKVVSGRGYATISKENAVDRGWLEKALNSGEVQLFKMTKEENPFNFGDKVNIFAETSLGSDPDLAEVANTELIEEASVKYERAVADIDAKETKLDLQLAQIDTMHNALKTEYDSVKQIVSKNIDRSFKCFNA